MNLNEILSKRDLKPIFNFIKENWGIDDISFLDQYAFRLTDKNKIYFVNKEVFDIDVSSLRVDLIGVYFGEWKFDALRVSIEGSQIIGKYATKNVLELDKEDSRTWLRGFDLDVDEENSGFLIIKSGSDFMGCGKVKDGRLLNFIPKIRRIKSVD